MADVCFTFGGDFVLSERMQRFTITNKGRQIVGLHLPFATHKAQRLQRVRTN
jgi:hypothetical protein